jgi:hypothetical protein
MDRCAAFSYTRARIFVNTGGLGIGHTTKSRFAVAGDFPGDCGPAHHRNEPIYHDITVREALN